VFGSEVARQHRPTPQVQSIKIASSHPASYGLIRTYRMANNGSSDNFRITSHYHLTGPTGPPQQGFVWDRDSGGSGNFTPMLQASDTEVIAAMCANWDGIVGGKMDGNGNGVVPTWWNESNSFAYNQITNSGQTGLFWDVTGTVSNDTYFAGYFFDGTDKRGVRVKKSNGSKELVPEGNYDGSEARGINKDLDLCGQLFGDGADPPVVWQWNGSSYTLIDVSASDDWPEGRSGYLIGITDRNGHDSNGPYAVGFMSVSESDSPAQPFIYSVGTDEIRFLGTQFGPPEQITNFAYDSADPVVSFIGNSPMPYIWIGSPNKSSTNFGCANDVWAFLDPDVTQAGDSAAVVTGIDRSFVFGGSTFVTNNDNVFMSKSSSWSVGSGTRTITMTCGTVLSGSTSDLAVVDGKYVSVAPGEPLLATDPEIVIQVDQNLSSADIDALAFRSTGRKTVSATFTMKLYLYKWTSPAGWVQIDSRTMQSHMQTLVGQTDDISDFVDTGNSNKVRALITVKLGSSYFSPWSIDFEQGVFLVK
jgi:hypothetical protein